MRHVIFERSYISKARITVIIIIMSSYVLDPNMSVTGNGTTNFNGTSTSTLDTKGNSLYSVNINGASVSLASPLRVTQYLRPYSGTFTSNNHDIRARNWYNYVTQNATMTINLGTTSLTIDYRYRSGDNNYSSSYGDLTLNNASSTIIMGGRYWYDYSESYWPRVMIDNTLSNYSYHSFGPHGNFGLIKSVTPSEVRFQSSNPRGGSSIPFYINHLEVTSSAQFSGNVSFTTLKLLGNGSIYTFAGGKTYSVSETFIIGQADGCAITTVKSNSPGTAANLVSSATVTSTYLDMQDISFTGVGSQGSNNVTFNANSSIDNGNNSGVTFGALIERNMYWITKRCKNKF